MSYRSSLAVLAATLLASPALAQSNTIAGLDVALGQLGDIDAVNRTGTFPNGTSAAAMSTTSCNFGVVQVPWFEPMDEEHPFIAFLVSREDSDGRLVQISNRSWVKHGFFALADNQCNLGCSPPGSFGNYLGVGCSDTYGISNNSDNFFLGPPEEIDPWLGEWEAVCSFFDLGLTGTTCNGLRSFTQGQAGSLGPIGNRIHLADEDLVDGGKNAKFAYQAHYVINGESDAVRDNNLGWRPMTAIWNGSKWNLNPSASMVQGSILQAWTGANVTSGGNAGNDGRAYVAVKVTGPIKGKWHYEYAVHNRDNSRGISEFRLPICSGGVTDAFGFRDIDDDGSNDWTAQIVGNELVYSTTSNPIEWNTFYNFWFDSDVAPEAGASTMTQFRPGPGNTSFGVQTTVPTRRVAIDLGVGCALSGIPPRLVPGGNSSQPNAGIPAIGNSNFGLLGLDHTPGALGLLYGSGIATALPLPPNCTLYLDGLFGIDILLYQQGVANGNGVLLYLLPVPNNPMLEGARIKMQAAVIVLGGPIGGIADLTNGIELRVGSSTTGCN